jgi:hypothetical protein
MASPFPAIPGYRPLRLLGEGGMGRVFLAEDEALGRRVAVKTISPNVSGRGGVQTRFLREARAMATVEHPRVVRVYSYGDAGGEVYFVMEYVDGETLAARLQRAPRLAWQEALRVTREIAEALAAAWRRGIVHRDVKPGNILLDRDGHVHVADFGLARPMSGDAGITGADVIVGSPHYISPEQARAKPVDFRSDVYSLGVVLFEMLAGRRPYEATSPVEVIAKHLSEELPELRQLTPDVPPPVDHLVEWMTRKDPAERPPSYEALIDHLSLQTDSSATAAPTTTMPSFRRRRPSKRLPMLAALVLVLAMAAAGWLWTTRRTLAPRPPGAIAVAIAPFYGPDDVSAREGRLMAAMVEREAARMLPGEDVVVLSLEQVGAAVQGERAARDTLVRVRADLVVWGELLAFRGETEVQAYLTAELRPGEHAAELGAAPPLVVSGGGESAVEMRRHAASAIAERLARVVARRALDAKDERRALRILERAGTSPETSELRVMAGARDPASAGAPAAATPKPQP